MSLSYFRTSGVMFVSAFEMCLTLSLANQNQHAGPSFLRCPIVQLSMRK